MDKVSRLEANQNRRLVRPLPEVGRKGPTRALSITLIFLIILLGLMLLRHMVTNNIEAPRTSLERDIMDNTAKLQLDPENPVAHAGLGTAYMKMGRANEALHEFKTAVRLKPKSAQYRYNLAIAYRELGETAKALARLRDAKGLARDWDVPFFTSGQVYLEKKDYEKAIRDFQTCLEMNPRNADAHLALGQAFEGQGKREKAAQAYREVLKYVPNYSEAKEALMRLETK